MAKLYVTEFADLPAGHNGSPQIVQQPPLVDQTPVVIGAGALSSAAFGAQTKVVRLETDVICSILFGASPTATANNARMAANSVEYFYVRPGDVVSVITNT